MTDMSRFQRHAIIWRWVSQKLHEIDTRLLQTTNKSDIWSTELCHRRRLDQHSRLFQLLFSENKYSLLFRSLRESPGDLIKHGTANVFEWPLKVISGTINGFVVCIILCQIYNIYNVRSQLLLSDVVWAIISAVLFNQKGRYMMLSAIC